jgi:hypothetical protein
VDDADYLNPLSDGAVEDQVLLEALLAHDADQRDWTNQFR